MASFFSGRATLNGRELEKSAKMELKVLNLYHLMLLYLFSLYHAL